MGSHDPFAYLKHKLWPKEGSRIWNLFYSSPLKVKNRPDLLMCRWRATYRSKSSQWRIQLCFKPHFNGKYAQEVIGLQNRRKPNSRNFSIPNLGVPRQNDIWVQAPWPNINNIISGKVVASPKSKPWWVLWVRVCPWLVRAPKMFQLCTNQLVWFVQVHVNNWRACHSS